MACSTLVAPQKTMIGTQKPRATPTGLGRTSNHTFARSGGFLCKGCMFVDLCQNENFVPPADHHDTRGQYDPSIHSVKGVNAVSMEGYPQAINDRIIQTTHELNEFRFNQDMNSGNSLGLGREPSHSLFKKVYDSRCRLVAIHHPRWKTQQFRHLLSWPKIYQSAQSPYSGKYSSYTRAVIGEQLQHTDSRIYAEPRRYELRIDIAVYSDWRRTKATGLSTKRGPALGRNCRHAPYTAQFWYRRRA